MARAFQFVPAGRCSVGGQILTDSDRLRRSLPRGLPAARARSAGRAPDFLSPSSLFPSFYLFCFLLPCVCASLRFLSTGSTRPACRAVLWWDVPFGVVVRAVVSSSSECSRALRALRCVYWCRRWCLRVCAGVAAQPASPFAGSPWIFPEAE